MFVISRVVKGLLLHKQSFAAVMAAVMAAVIRGFVPLDTNL